MEDKHLVFLPDDVYKELKKIWKEFNDADDPETIAISIYALLVFLPDDVYKELKKIGKEFNDADDPETIAISIYALKSGKNSTTGTDAHSLCEYKLKAALGMDADDPTEDLTYYDQEMDDCATGYASYVMEQVETAKENCFDPVVLIEQRVDFSRWVKQGFGTADCIVIADGTLQIIDFKYGLGVLVSAEENPQMMCYALGALELLDDIYDISTVRMTIYQPRRDNLSTYELSKEDLYRWAEEVLKPAADLAFAGDGNFSVIGTVHLD